MLKTGARLSCPHKRLTGQKFPKKSADKEKKGPNNRFPQGLRPHVGGERTGEEDHGPGPKKGGGGRSMTMHHGEGKPSQKGAPLPATPPDKAKITQMPKKGNMGPFRVQTGHLHSKWARSIFRGQKVGDARG